MSDDLQTETQSAGSLHRATETQQADQNGSAPFGPANGSVRTSQRIRFAVAAVLLSRETMFGNRHSVLILEMFEAESADQAIVEMHRSAMTRYPERQILHILCADTQAPNDKLTDAGQKMI